MELLKGLVITHPTVTIRRLMRKPNLYVKASLGALEVYSCYQLKQEQYEFLPKNNTCSELLPIRFTYVNKTYDAYLDPLDNVIHPFSVDASCVKSGDRPVFIDGKIRLYDPESGKLKMPETIETIDISSVSLNAALGVLGEASFAEQDLHHHQEAE